MKQVTYKQNIFNPKLKYKKSGIESVYSPYFKYFPHTAYKQEELCLNCSYCCEKNGYIFCQHKTFKGDIFIYIANKLLCPKSTAPLSLLKRLMNGNKLAKFK